MRCRCRAACRTCWSSGWPSTVTRWSASPCTFPHYLAQTDYPSAAEALLAEVAKSGSLQIPLAALTQAAAEVHDKINEQVEASSEVAQVVEALERQYDAFVAAQENRSLLARDEDLPSGDELGAEFERFLAQQAGDKSKDDDDNK